MKNPDQESRASTLIGVDLIAFGERIQIVSSACTAFTTINAIFVFATHQFDHI
jgi:hypothetical protein